MILTINDETLTGDILNKIEIDIDRDKLTVKDLIEARVTYEVELVNKGQSTVRSTFMPSKEEQKLNKTAPKTPTKKVDPEKETYIAWEGFKANRFFVFVDNRQVETLEEEVIVSPSTSVSFVKLTPLVGG